MDWIPFADDTFWVHLTSFATTILYVAQQKVFIFVHINPLNAELNPICYFLALLELTIFSTLAG